jgi:ABC-type glycerol-3-phosphate transport system substrate-binding protein
MGEKVSRRDYLKVLGGTVGGLVVGAAIGYLAAPGKVVEKTVERTVTQTITATPTVTPTTPAKKVELPGWQWGAEYEAVNKALETIANEWNAAHPEAIVKYTIFPELTEVEYALKVRQAAEAGKPPALFYMTNTTILTDLASDGYLEEPPSDVLDAVKKAIDPAFHYMLNMYSPEGEVKPYAGAVTIGLSACALYYNKRLFSEVGLDPNKPPQTWDELIDAAKALVKRDSTGKMIRAGYSVRRGGNPGGIGEKFIPFAVGNGAKIIYKEGNKWYTDINEKPVIEAAQFLYDLIHVYKVDDLEFPSWGYDPWLNETCAISGPLGVGFITNVQSSKPEMLPYVGVTNVPSPGGIKTACSFGDLNVIAVCSKATKEQKEKAWEFIKFFNSPTNIRRISNDIWNWTPYKDSINNPPFSTEKAWQELNKVLSNVGRPHIVNEYGPGWLTLTYTLGENLKRAFTKEVSVKEALDRTYEKWTEYMKTLKFYSG